MVLLAGLSTLLHRLTGQEDITVGSPVARRDRLETEGLIGLFLNTLPLRLRVPGGVPFRELIAAARAVSLEAHAYGEVPFERLVEAVRSRRDPSRSPLFQVLFALQEGAAGELRLPGVSAREIPVHTGTAKLDLTLSLAAADGGLAGGFELNSALFDAATIQRWAGHLTTLLAGAAADPARPAGDLPLLTPAEERALAGWNATAAPFPRGRGLHELFAAQAARTPEAVAIVHGHQRVTYRELEVRSGRLARRLRSLGVGPEVLVGILAERTPGMVAAMLAALRAGGGYLPLDPSYPRERLDFLLADSGARVVLAQESLPPASPRSPGRRSRSSPWNGKRGAARRCPPSATPISSPT